jgi:hypothetical protein
MAAVGNPMLNAVTAAIATSLNLLIMIFSFDNTMARPAVYGAMDVDLNWKILFAPFGIIEQSACSRNSAVLSPQFFQAEISPRA